MATAPMTSDSPVIGQDGGASYAVESAGADDAPLKPLNKDYEAADGAIFDCDDDVTVIVPKWRLWLLRKRMPLRILTAFGVVTVGLLATGMLRRAIARRPVSAQSPSLPTKALSAAATNQPSANVPLPIPPAPATMAESAEPEAAQPALADSTVPTAIGSAASAQKPGRTIANIVPQVPVPAQDNAALAVCQDALAKKDTAAIVQGCDSALEIDTTLAIPILAWAKRELDRGNVKVAVAWAHRVLQADDHLADAYLIVGVAEQAASHASAAKTAYRRYLELAPKGRYARDVRSSLAAL